MLSVVSHSSILVTGSSCCLPAGVSELLSRVNLNADMKHLIPCPLLSVEESLMVHAKFTQYLP